jgi:hypothetical protein
VQYNELVEHLQNLTGHKLTQKEFASILGIGQTAVSNKVVRGTELTIDELLKVERSLGLPLGTLSGITASEDCIKLDYIHIAPSCGRGTVVLDDAEVTPIRIGKEIIKDIWKISSPEVLKLFRASGDSMENTIEDGNILLVDTSRTDYHNGGIYVLTINNDWFVKRLRLKVTGELEIISDNPKYEPEILKPNTDIEIKVVGRVIKNLTRGL